MSQLPTLPELLALADDDLFLVRDTSAGADDKTTVATLRESLAKPQEYAGDPNGILAARYLYDEAIDISVSPIDRYIATVTDGTAGGTTWERFVAINRAGTRTLTSATTLTASDHGKTILLDASTAAFTVTLPAHSDGFSCTLKKIDDTTNAVTVNDAAAATVRTLVHQDEAWEPVSDDTNWQSRGMYLDSGKTSGDLAQYEDNSAGDPAIPVIGGASPARFARDANGILKLEDF